MVLIEAPLAPSRVDGSPTPSSDLPWRVRVYSPDYEAEGTNVYVDPWEVATYAFATISIQVKLPAPPPGFSVPELHLPPSSGDKALTFRNAGDAERWYAQNIPSRDKPYVPHKVIDGENGTFRLLIGPTAYDLLHTICSGGRPSCHLLGQLPH